MLGEHLRVCKKRASKPIKEKEETCNKLMNGEEELNDRKAYP